MHDAPQDATHLDTSHNAERFVPDRFPLCRPNLSRMPEVASGSGAGVDVSAPCLATRGELREVADRRSGRCGLATRFEADL